jgi:hypothetical protein
MDANVSSLSMLLVLATIPCLPNELARLGFQRDTKPKDH